MILDELRNNTVSSLFIVPILKLDRKKLKEFGFINSFLFNGEEPDEDDIGKFEFIHLVFKPDDMEKFNDFVFIQRTTRKDIVEERDYPGNYVVVTYKLPKRYKDDYKKLWDGKYSKVSQTYQNLIPGTIRRVSKDGDVSHEVSAQHMIFSKYEPLKNKLEELFEVNMDDDQELWTVMTIDKETFKISNYEKSVATNAV